MIRSRRLWVAAALTGATLFLLYRRPAPETPAPLEIRAAAFWETRLPDLDDAPQPLMQWLGKVLVVNFWASCCLPCQKEIPAFIALQNKHGGQGLQFVGVAMEAPDKAGAYATKVGMNYPILRGETAGTQLGRDAGNLMGGMPYTVVFDRRGNAVAALTGEVSSARLENLILPLL
jgi:thiol-disulfide isomerase/thioredoxin